MRDEYEFRFLMKMYEECQLQRRHHESYRAKLTAILGSIYAAILTAISTADFNILILSLVLLMLSAFGLISTISYTERYVFYWRRSQMLREIIDEKYANVHIEEIFDMAKLYRKFGEEEKWPNHIPEFLGHHKIWMWAHVIVLLVSIIIIICSGCIRAA